MLQFHTLTDEEVRQLSDTLFNARTTGKALPEFPGKLPATLEQAYAVQDLSIAASDDNVVGWKVGMVIPELREQMKSERIMGPVFKNVAHFIGHSHGDNEYIELPVYTDGFIAVDGGSIVNYTSNAAWNAGGPGAGIYGVSKAAVNTLTRALAKELAPAGIRVNAVSPGTIDTPFHAQIKATKPEVFASWKDSILLGRLGQPEEVASVVSFLVSEDASFITAETVQIGGGQALGI